VTNDILSILDNTNPKKPVPISSREN
jgi:hypothetical protein